MYSIEADDPWRWWTWHGMSINWLELVCERYDNRISRENKQKEWKASNRRFLLRIIYCMCLCTYCNRRPICAKRIPLNENVFAREETMTSLLMDSKAFSPQYTIHIVRSVCHRSTMCCASVHETSVQILNEMDECSANRKRKLNTKDGRFRFFFSSPFFYLLFVRRQLGDV